uniref:Serine/threonine-protein phosphatase PGAM5, mitochondrial n=1 Tax=Globodera rostochiensis TaxID=31243 RepID=A0A914HPC9_GLORO
MSSNCWRLLFALQQAGKKNADSNSVALHPFGSGEVQRWDHNWDKRDPFSLIDVEAFRVADEEKQKEMLAKVTPTATRNIFLIRHGQYELDSKKRELTSLGREQADILGKRLAGFEIGKGHKFNKCVVSTLQRADETAQIALKHLPHVAEIRKNTDLLVEGAPCEPEPPSSSWRPQYYSYTDGARIEAAFRKFIHRAKPKQKEDSFELFFFHANVIRYFVCRALQFPPEGWLRLSLVNSSITWIRIQPDGRLRFSEADNPLSAKK